MKKFMLIISIFFVILSSKNVYAADSWIFDNSSNYSYIMGNCSNAFDNNNSTYSITRIMVSPIKIKLNKVYDIKKIQLNVKDVYIQYVDKYDKFIKEDSYYGAKEGLFDVNVEAVAYIVLFSINKDTDGYLYELDFFGDEHRDFSILTTNPANNSLNIGINTNFELNFNDYINSNTLDNIVMDGVNFNKSVNAKKIILSPTAPLSYNTQYVLNVNNVYSIDGILQKQPYQYIFKTIEKLQNPILTLSSTVKKISVSWNNVQNAQKYNVYLNDIKVAELDSTINNYTYENLNHDTSYKVKVEAVAANYVSSFTEQFYQTKNYYSAKPEGNIEVSQFSALIKWNEIADTKFYEVRLNDNTIIRLDSNITEYKFNNLFIETSYIAYIRQINLVDVYSDWTAINFTTLGPPEVAPAKPVNLFVVSKGQNFIEVEVSAVLWSTQYKFYLNNDLKVTQEGRIYKFEGLNESTQYSISAKSSNVYGDCLFPISIIVKTDEKPMPTVIDGKSSFVNGSPTKQNVSWESKNVQQGFKIYVDGKLIKELPAGTTSTEIDMTELGITKNTCDISIEPIDADGKGYKFQTISKGTGSPELDGLTGKMLDAKNIIKKGGLILLQSIIVLCLLFVIALFLFNKMKLNLSTNDDVSLEANPDEQIKAIDSKNKFDRDAYFTAKVEESSHAKDKSVDFNFKSILNKMVNGKSRKKERKYHINVKGKKVEIDKTSFHANKYSDFKKLSNDKEFYQWQNKYNDFSQGSFNKFTNKSSKSTKGFKGSSKKGNYSKLY